MAGNRRTKSAEVRFGPVLKVIVLCAMIGGSAIGYVWQQSEIKRLGRQIAERESRLTQLKNDNKTLADQIAILRSPPMLDRRVKEWNLGLVPAQPSQMVRLMDVPAAPPIGDPRQIAQRPLAGGTP